MIDLVISQFATPTVIPGNRHRYDKPLGRPVGADNYRIAATAIVPAGPGSHRDELEANLDPAHRTELPYGIVLLESQLMAVMVLLHPDQIRAYRAGQPLDSSDVGYGYWPSGRAWEDVLPKTTWWPAGVGVLEEYRGVSGAKVTVYEYTVDKASQWQSAQDETGEMVSMVSWHCERCHEPGGHDLGEKWENLGPQDRSWAASKARIHARGSDGKCRLPDDRMESVVAEVFSKPLIGRASGCAVSGPCSRVRLARAVGGRLTPA